MKKRIIAWVIATAMIVTMVPMMALAKTTDQTPVNNDPVQTNNQTPDQSGDPSNQSPQDQKNDSDEQVTENDIDIIDGDEEDEDDDVSKKPSVVVIKRGSKILNKWGGKVTSIKGNKKSAKFKLAYGKKKVIRITPNSGFKVSKITVNGKQKKNGKKIAIRGNGKKIIVNVQFRKNKVFIMLDPGHAGHYNRGVISRYWESIMTWQLTNMLKDELEEYNIGCGMTKMSLFHDPSVYGRGLKAKGYDLFISIHSNYSDARGTDYPLAIVSSKYKSNLYKKAQPLGKKLAANVREQMKTRQPYQVWIKRQTDGQDWYGVIRGAAKVNVPGIIVEHSFHSNPGKCRWLLNKKNLHKMAESEAKIIADYYGCKK